MNMSEQTPDQRLGQVVPIADQRVGELSYIDEHQGMKTVNPYTLRTTIGWTVYNPRGEPVWSFDDEHPPSSGAKVLIVGTGVEAGEASELVVRTHALKAAVNGPAWLDSPRTHRAIAPTVYGFATASRTSVRTAAGDRTAEVGDYIIGAGTGNAPLVVPRDVFEALYQPLGESDEPIDAEFVTCLKRGRGLQFADHWSGGGRVITGVDLGHTKKAGSDLTAMVTIVVLDDGTRRVLDVRSGRWTGDEIAANLEHLREMFDPQFFVESNGGQNLFNDRLQEGRVAARLGRAEDPRQRLVVGTGQAEEVAHRVLERGSALALVLGEQPVGVGALARRALGVLVGLRERAAGRPGTDAREHCREVVVASPAALRDDAALFERLDQLAHHVPHLGELARLVCDVLWVRRWDAERLRGRFDDRLQHREPGVLVGERRRSCLRHVDGAEPPPLEERHTVQVLGVQGRARRI